jgi:hypothetical protein
MIFVVMAVSALAIFALVGFCYVRGGYWRG